MTKPTYLFDIEANSQHIRKVTTIHCLCIMDADTGQTWNYRPAEIAEGVARLATAGRIVAHNGIQYDVPVLQRFHNVELPPCYDTLIVSRILYPDAINHPFGGNALADWGKKLGTFKTHYKGGWEDFNEEMFEYCQQDVVVLKAIYDEVRKLSKGLDFPIKLEHSVSTNITRQHLNGVHFNTDKADALVQQLVTDLAKIEDELQSVFPPKEIQLKTKVKYVPFNPGSRPQIAARLIEKYNWKPKALTEAGRPKMDEKVLKSLPFPEAKLIFQYLMQDKRLSMVNSLIAAADDTSRIYGEVTPIGTVTSRMAHKNPNLGQIPKVKSDKEKGILKGMAGKYGYEFRDLFEPTPGQIMVGADLSGIELRMLANRMWQWDNGEYARILLEDDIHTVNMNAAGLTCRDMAKTFIYAFLYGAGDEKLGTIIQGTRKDGADLRARFLAGLPALGHLLNYVKYRNKKFGTIIGLDGRVIPVRSDHMALNTQLQSDGSIVAKVAFVRACKLTQHLPVKFLLNVHDEFQTECPPELKDTVGKLLVRSMEEAGKILKVKIPVTGEYKTGYSWATTH